ncbi:hypothetical protein AM349_01335 [Citrobacter freundii]|nr:hypothetical protein CRT62_17145 [Raoultella planticola]ATM16558.1 hypothetical protein CRN15_17705 [Raoultella planticola]ATX94838.1 hypothetical protein AM349_01335 [Citrobacter freundii]KYW14574.1 hypothetical protein AMK92_23050 [Escherichia coli]PHH23497.1 hypothetical protein CRX55_05240 [Raoultella planticola]
MVFLGCIFSEVIVSYNHAALLMFQEYCNCLPLFYWRLSPQFFIDKSIINRDEPCFSNVIVLNNH